MIYKRNIVVNYISRACSNLIFTTPIWIAYYQGFLSAGDLSLIITIQYILTIIFEIPSGAIADILGRKNTVSLGYLSGAIGVLLLPFSSTFLHFLLIRIAFSIMDSFISGAEEALVYDSMKQDGVIDQYKAMYSKAIVFIQGALVFGSFFGGILYALQQSLPFILYGIALFVSFISTRFYIEPDIDSEKFSWSGYKTHFIAGLKESFKNPTVAAFSLYFVVVGGITWASQSFFNTSLLTELVSSGVHRGWIQSGIRLINLLLISFVFSKKNLFSTQQKLLFFPIAMITAYLPAIFVQGYYGIPFIELATLSSTVRFIYMSEITNSFYESKYRATAVSTISMLVSVVAVVLFGISTVVISQWGIKVMYSLLGGLSLLVVLPLYYKTKTQIK